MTQAAKLAQLGSPGISTGFKNRIINGAMVIDQRNAGASVSATDSSYAVDRFPLRTSQSGKYTAQQNAGSVTPPAGFTNYLGITSITSYSPVSGDYIGVQQKIEGFNVADLGLGTANAKTFTLSFWVRSSLTGTFGGSYRNSAQDRSYVFTYTINAANTWEQKSITVAGDTSGTWLTTNGVGLDLWFNLGSGSANATTAGSWVAGGYLTATGSVNVVSTNGATWYITGVQLEVGTTATDFEYRDYGRELIMCQRYFETTFNQGTAVANGVQSPDRKQGVVYDNSSTLGFYTRYTTTKRVTPTITLYKDQNAGSNGQWSFYNGSSWAAMTVAGNTIKEADFMIDFTASGRSFGQAIILGGNWTASAEL